MKKILAIAPLVFMFAVNGAAAAEKFTVNGEVSVEYRDHQSTVDEFKKDGYKFTTTLDMNYAFNEHFSAFARVAAQTANVKHDFYTAKGEGDAAGKVSLDHYGFIYNNAGVAYTLGQQSLALGQQGLMFDNTGNIGREIAGLQAINIEGTAGKVDVNAFYGQMHKTPAFDNEKLSMYGFGVKAPLAKDTHIGFNYAHSKHANVVSKNHYGVNLAHTMGKWEFQLEGIKSSAATANKGYAFATTYNPTEKDSFAVTLHRTEANADIAGMTAFENDQKGIVYSYSRQFNDRMGLTMEYMNNTYISQPGKYKSFATALTYSF